MQSSLDCIIRAPQAEIGSPVTYQDGTESAEHILLSRSANSTQDRFMVLVIDDDRESREALAEFLAFKGYVVQCVATALRRFCC